MATNQECNHLKKTVFLVIVQQVSDYLAKILVSSRKFKSLYQHAEFMILELLAWVRLNQHIHNVVMPLAPKEKSNQGKE